MTRFVVTGTDTGIGKTIFSAALVQATGASYWKPVQSGLEEETDSEVVRKFLPVAKPWEGGPLVKRVVEGPATSRHSPSVSPPGCHLPTPARRAVYPERPACGPAEGRQGGSILPEAYLLKTPASPHLAAEIDGVTIDPDALTPPPGDLIVEGAGGALVPVTRALLYADLFARWQIPVIVCARTSLGTINHCLLTIEALKSRNVPIHGLAFLGDAVEDSEAIIAELSGVRRLGRLPIVDPLTPEALAQAFAANFDGADFA